MKLFASLPPLFLLAACGDALSLPPLVDQAASADAGAGADASGDAFTGQTNDGGLGTRLPGADPPRLRLDAAATSPDGKTTFLAGRDPLNTGAAMVARCTADACATYKLLFSANRASLAVSETRVYIAGSDPANVVHLAECPIDAKDATGCTYFSRSNGSEPSVAARNGRVFVAFNALDREERLAALDCPPGNVTACAEHDVGGLSTRGPRSGRSPSAAIDAQGRFVAAHLLGWVDGSANLLMTRCTADWSGCVAPLLDPFMASPVMVDADAFVVAVQHTDDEKVSLLRWNDPFGANAVETHGTALDGAHPVFAAAKTEEGFLVAGISGGALATATCDASFACVTTARDGGPYEGVEVVSVGTVFGSEKATGEVRTW